MDNLLSLVTFLPLIGAAVLILLLRGEDELAARNAKMLALFTTVMTFVLSLAIMFGFDPQDTGFQFVEEYEWIGGLKYKMGVDGISVLFIMLTTFLMPIVIGASWHVEHRIKEYMVAFLALETLMIGVYTFLGSVLMLVAMVAMYMDAGTTDIPTLLAYEFSSETLEIWGWPIVGGVQTLLWLAFFASFAVKMPMWPVHTWLPDAHVQAPTAGSVVLAAVLLKMGGYGFLRFSLPMFPIASDLMANFVFTLSVIAIVYTSLVAMMQEDMKKLIAYSSVAHMGFVTMGIFAANQQGVDGAIFQMISHGFISGALFLCVGVIYDRMHTRDIDAYGGLVVRMPAYALIFMLFTMGNVGLPGTSGFVGEFLTLAGVFQVNTWVAFFAATGVILSAAYALWLYRRVVFGDLIKASLKGIQDLTGREKLLFAPLVVMTILLGVYPSLAIDVFAPAVAALLDDVETAQAAFAGAVETAQN